MANKEMKGYVYSADLTFNEFLQMLSGLFGEGDCIVVRRVNDAEFLHYHPDQAALFVTEWDEGQVFSGKAEVRWRRKGDFWAALLLSESGRESLLLKPANLITKWLPVADAPFNVVIPSSLDTHGFLLWGTRPDGEQWWESRIPRPLHYPESYQSSDRKLSQPAYRLYCKGETVRWIRLAKREGGKVHG